MSKEPAAPNGRIDGLPSSRSVNRAERGPAAGRVSLWRLGLAAAVVVCAVAATGASATSRQGRPQRAPQDEDAAANEGESRQHADLRRPSHASLPRFPRRSVARGDDGLRALDHRATRSPTRGTALKGVDLVGCGFDRLRGPLFRRVYLEHPADRDRACATGAVPPVRADGPQRWPHRACGRSASGGRRRRGVRPSARRAPAVPRCRRCAAPPPSARVLRALDS